MPVQFDFATAGAVRFGAGRVSEAPAALADLGVRRAFVVTGATTSRADRIRAELAEAGIPSTVFAVAGEPSVDLVRSAVRAATESGCDGVLGYGGGSALDAAKAVAGLAVSDSDLLEHMEVIGAGRPLEGPGLPCVAAPTTAGTGSEVTRNSVLSHGSLKASLRSPHLLPRVAVVDPDLIRDLPPHVIAYSGIDALSQLIEPFLSARSNPLTDALARDGMQRSARSLRRAYQDGIGAASQAAVREDLALASLFGGLCLANSGLGAVHGFAAAAGAHLSAPHGAVCAALLPATMDANLHALRARAPGRPATARFAEIAALLTGRSTATPEEAIDWVEELTAALSVPGLAAHGLGEADIPELVAAASGASSMRGNPIDLTEAELAEIVERSM